MVQQQSKILALQHPVSRPLEMGHEVVGPGNHGKEDIGAFSDVTLRHKVRRQTGVAELLGSLVEPKDALGQAREYVAVAA
jgi:hypothetical protein